MSRSSKPTSTSSTSSTRPAEHCVTEDSSPVRHVVTILQQLRQNAVAIISLFIAVSSLSYNSWRYEQTEDNQNQRMAAFEILFKLGELQNVVFHHRYDKDHMNLGNPRTGWSHVLLIRDLSQLMHPPMPERSEALLTIWDQHWQSMGDQQASADAILGASEEVRQATLALLESLE